MVAWQTLTLQSGKCFPQTWIIFLYGQLTSNSTGTDNPYCGTIAFPGGITDYFCGTLSGSRVQSAKTTWDGETDGRTFLTYSNTGESSTLAVPTIESSSSVSVSSTVISSPSGTVGLGGPSTDPADDSDQPEPKKEKGGSNIGAIVGGAVGGLAVIGLVILGIVWMMRRKRNNNNANAPDTPAMSTTAAASGPGGGGGHPGLASSPPPPAPSPGTGGGNLDPALNSNSHNSYYYAGSPDPTKVPVMTQHYPAPASPPPPTDYNNNGQQPPQWGNNSHNGSSPTSGYIPPSSPASTLMSGGGYQPSSISNPSAHPHHMSGQSFTGFQPQGQPNNIYGPGGQPVYEAASNVVGGPQELNANHRGQMHELQ